MVAEIGTPFAFAKLCRQVRVHIFYNHLNPQGVALGYYVACFQRVSLQAESLPPHSMG